MVEESRWRTVADKRRLAATVPVTEAANRSPIGNRFVHYFAPVQACCIDTVHPTVTTATIATLCYILSFVASLNEDLFRSDRGRQYIVPGTGCKAHGHTWTAQFDATE